MNRYSKFSLMAIAIAAAGTVAYAADVATAEQTASVKPFTGEKLAKNAKITMVDARAIALKAHPGKIADEVPFMR